MVQFCNTRVHIMLGAGGGKRRWEPHRVEGGEGNASAAVIPAVQLLHRQHVADLAVLVCLCRIKVQPINLHAAKNSSISSASASWSGNLQVSSEIMRQCAEGKLKPTCLQLGSLNLTLESTPPSHPSTVKEHHTNVLPSTTNPRCTPNSLFNESTPPPPPLRPLCRY